MLPNDTQKTAYPSFKLKSCVQWDLIEQTKELRMDVNESHEQEQTQKQG